MGSASVTRAATQVALFLCACRLPYTIVIPQVGMCFSRIPTQIKALRSSPGSSTTNLLTSTDQPLAYVINLFFEEGPPR